MESYQSWTCPADEMTGVLFRELGLNLRYHICIGLRTLSDVVGDELPIAPVDEGLRTEMSLPTKPENVWSSTIPTDSDLVIVDELGQAIGCRLFLDCETDYLKLWG